MRNPVAKCFASIALMSPMYTRIRHIRCVCVHDETGSAGCEFPHKTCTQAMGGNPPCCVRVCVYMCENVHSFVYSFVISIFSTRYAFIGVVCCRINQLNYLWWWINRFVFRWRAQLAALSTTNCRRIEWWNLERERVLGQSQCYSWFRGFFLTQLHASEVRDAVAIRDWLFLSEWWVGSLPSYQRISIPSVTY